MVHCWVAVAERLIKWVNRRQSSFYKVFERWNAAATSINVRTTQSGDERQFAEAVGLISASRLGSGVTHAVSSMPFVRRGVWW